MGRGGERRGATPCLRFNPLPVKEKHRLPPMGGRLRKSGSGATGSIPAGAPPEFGEIRPDALDNARPGRYSRSAEIRSAFETTGGRPEVA